MLRRACPPAASPSSRSPACSRSTSPGPSRCSTPPARYSVEVVAPGGGTVATSSGLTLGAAPLPRPAPRSARHADRRRRRGHARRRAARRWPTCAPRRRGRAASRRSAPARSSWRPRACSTAAARPRTGPGATRWRGGTRRWRSIPSRSGSATATSGRRPASPRASTSRWPSSPTTSARRRAAGRARARGVPAAPRAARPSSAPAWRRGPAAERPAARAAGLGGRPSRRGPGRRPPGRARADERALLPAGLPPRDRHDPRRLRRGAARRARVHGARGHGGAGRGRRAPSAASAASRPCAAPSIAGWAWARPPTAAASGWLPDPEENTMDVAIPIYDAFTALDAVGPYEVLSRVPGARVRFIAPRPGAVTTDNGMLSVVAEASLDEVPAPGGAGRAGRDLLVGGRARRGVRRLGAPGPRDLDVDDVGLRGRADPRRGRDPRRPEGDDALARLRGARDLRRAPDAPARRRAGQGHHVGRGVGGDRHGAHAGGPAGGRRRGPRDPAGHRVRPAAAVRRRARSRRPARRSRRWSARPSRRAPRARPHGRSEGRLQQLCAGPERPPDAEVWSSVRR